MPFAAALSSLTLFLILAYLLPATTILATLLLLFPSLVTSLDMQNPLLAAGAVLVIAFIHGFPCQLIEFIFLDRLWSRIYPEYQIKQRKQLAAERSSIITKAEILSKSHGHLDQTLGEYILFLNTGLWVGTLALIRLIGFHWWGIGFEFLFALVVLLAALLSVLYVSPLWKKKYFDILEVIKSMVEKEECTSAPKS